MTNIFLFAILIILISLWRLTSHKIDIDRKSKEQLFQIQMAGAQATSLKNALPVDDMYKILTGMVQFYTFQQLSNTNLSKYTDQNLSLIVDDMILSIASEVELHLGDNFKQSWECYFDKIPTSQEHRPSHLNLYIYNETRICLINSIELSKRRHGEEINEKVMQDKEQQKKEK